MQKIKISHRANFRAKYKCFPQILFPVRAILRSINFRCTDFITDSADECILVMACVDCARVHLKTLSSLLKPDVTSLFVGWSWYENSRSFLPRPWFQQKAHILTLYAVYWLATYALVGKTYEQGKPAISLVQVLRMFAEWIWNTHKRMAEWLERRIWNP